MVEEFLNGIEEKVNDLFLAYQIQLGVEDGGLDFDEAFELDAKMYELASCMGDIIERQQERNGHEID